MRMIPGAAALLFLQTMLLPLTLSARPGDKVGEIATPGPCPTGLTWDGKALWVADRLEDRIYRLDPATGRVLKEFPSPGIRPTGLAWDGTHLWNADALNGQLFRIDPQTGKWDRTLSTPASQPQGLAWHKGYLWLADESAGRIYQIAPADGRAVRAFRAPHRQTTGLAWMGDLLWAADKGTDRLYLADPTRDEVVSSLPTPGPHPRGLAWDGKALWVADYRQDRLLRVEVGQKSQVLLGETIIEDVLFSYELRNHGPDAVEPLDVFVALPESLAGQRILDEPQLEPSPLAIVQDGYGQRVAHFRFDKVRASAVAKVRMRLKAALRDVNTFILPQTIGSLKDIPQEVARLYLADGEKLQIKDRSIQAAVREALKGESNPYWMARRIARYVADHLRYELAGGWSQAPYVLKRGTGSCSEYTFVFMAMCRAAGLPARYAAGYVMRGDQAAEDEVFHRWPEVYLPSLGWVPFDAQAGDKSLPAERAGAMGRLEARYLITTVGGGDSKHLGWTYNVQDRYLCHGRCKTTVDSAAEWSPGQRPQTSQLP